MIGTVYNMVMSRRVRWVRHVVCVGEKKFVCKVLAGKAE